MSRITTRQLVELIQGKDLSTSEIYELVQNKYPGNSLTSNVLITRLKSMATSPNVEIIVKGRGAKARYKLISATERFMELAEINYRSNTQPVKSDTTLWHFHPVELRFCHMHKLFDQALASVRGRVSA